VLESDLIIHHDINDVKLCNSFTYSGDFLDCSLIHTINFSIAVAEVRKGIGRDTDVFIGVPHFPHSIVSSERRNLPQ
jgi:hypothetical protein